MSATCERCGDFYMPHQNCDAAFCDECSGKILGSAEIVEEYKGKDGHRYWSNSGVWLYPGQKIILIDTSPPI